MGHRSRTTSLTGASSFYSTSECDVVEYVDASALASDVEWPFGRIDSIDRDDLRETAYELFFTSCRSSPGFGGKNPITFYPSNTESVGASGGGGGGGEMSQMGGKGGSVGSSKIKKALGLKAKKSSPRKTSVLSSKNSTYPGRFRRPLTSAEIMRQQMRVTDQSDHRLRKTLMRTQVGQTGRRAETIILPLELLRQLKPSEFADIEEYHFWQKRQLRILEAGLLLYPSIPLEPSNTSAHLLRDIIRTSELKPLDTSKNSEAMRTLCDSVTALAYRSNSETCNWIDGFPINIHIYTTLLQSIFDVREQTVVVDEVDELLELMKKTWTTLGINRPIHNVCLTWVFFQQFVSTGQTEPDLLCAAVSMLAEIGNDGKKTAERDQTTYGKVTSATLKSMLGWAERKLFDYHWNFGKDGDGDLRLMENVLPLAITVAKIIEDNVPGKEKDNDSTPIDSTVNRVDCYIRSSLRNAFNKILEENQKIQSSTTPDPSEAAESLLQLARQTEELALNEKEQFSQIFKNYHPLPAGVAAATLHSCYGVALKQYLSGRVRLSEESIRALQTAGKLEKLLVQMVVEDSVNCDDGGKGMVREMVPYDVDSVVLGLVKSWMQERLKVGKENSNRAKDAETWSQRSKSEPHASFAVELMNLVKETVDDFFEIPVIVQEDLVQEFADGLEALILDYTAFVASCGSKRSYKPRLPPLTRCNQDSRFRHLWRKVIPCNSGVEPATSLEAKTLDHDHPRPSTSRGTQRLYVRLNTLHYILYNLNYVERCFSLHRRQGPSPPSTDTSSPSNSNSRGGSGGRISHTSHLFDVARLSVQSAAQHVAEVAAYRLIFLDSNCSFYEGLYHKNVANARIRPALRTLKQNLTLLVTVVTDRAQPLAVKEVMKASFEAFLMTLLAGGSDRAFTRADNVTIVEDFESLKRVFATCGEGLVAEEVVEREAEVVAGVLALMALPTEQLVEDFVIAACEASGLGCLSGGGQKVPMPPTTGRWNRKDPNTILRVLCYRNDEVSDRFLNKSFELPRRR